jgi:hypothetical protein
MRYLFFLCFVACGAPFEGELIAPLPEGAVDHVRVTEAGRVEAATDAGTSDRAMFDVGAPDRAATDAGAPDQVATDATPDRDPSDAGCTPSPSVSYVECPGIYEPGFTQPANFCLWNAEGSQASYPVTPAECQCAGQYTCACLAGHYADPCVALGLKSMCQDIKPGMSESDGAVVMTTEPIWQCYQ